ncbi:MAG: ABC transporter permease, partial [Desulfobacula sp.]|nr:ABC transporter permease [Desulfobacula sp.]
MCHYIKSIVTSIKKNRFFYSINLIGFLTGFLVLAIIFTFVFQELSFDRFHENAKNIYRIHSGGYGVTPPCFAEKLKNKIPEINGIVRFSTGDLTIVDKDQELHIGKTYYTDPDIFNHFSFKLLSGDAMEVLNAPFSIVINKSTANKLFGNGSPVGESVQDKNGTVYTITAVMEDIPYNSHIQANAFISIETLRHSGKENEFGCGAWGILTYVSLSDKANCKEVEEKINSILDDSKMETDEGKFHLELQALKKVYFDFENNKFDGSKHGNRQTVLLYFAISILILLIVIINYINLSTLIAGGRIKEIAIRKINGATRFHIIKQVLLEALGTVLISFLLAWLVIELLLPQLSSLLNISVSDSQNRSLLYLSYFIAISIIGLISGLIPGLFLSGISEIKALKNESFLSSRGLQRKVLLVIQLLIVALVLDSTFIINNQVSFILKKDIGFHYDNVVYFNLDNTLIKKWKILKSELLQSPNVKFVSFSDGLIGQGLTKATMNCNDKSKLCNFYSIDPDYIDLYRMRIKSGRSFFWDFKSDIDNSCIINEAACKAFELTNPLGKKVGHRTIIGIVHDFNYTSLHNHIEPLVICCGSGGNVIQIKISTDNKDKTVGFINTACKSISPGFENNFSFLNNKIKELYKPELDLKNSFEVYSIITFIIALLGLFGLFLFTLKRKAKEISIRKLFGAKFMDTFKLLA